MSDPVSTGPTSEPASSPAPPVHAPDNAPDNATDHIAPQFVLWLCIASVCVLVGSVLVALAPFIIMVFVVNYFWRSDRRDARTLAGQE